MTDKVDLSSELDAGNAAGAATANGELIETVTELEQGTTATPPPAASERST